MKPSWRHLVYLIYCADAGVYLLLVPWSLLWRPMAFSWPEPVRRLLLAGAARGAISALGLLLIAVCAVDLARFCRALKEAP
jgi:hypothetical protein